MKNYKSVVVLFIVVFLRSFEAYPQVYQVGSFVKDFKLPNVDGSSVSLSNFRNAKGFIIVFTCNTCPFSKLYEERLKQLDSKYKQLGFPLLTINPNDPNKEPDDSLEKMKLRAKEKQYLFPYLFDEDQKVSSLFVPQKTPHAFIIIRENNNNKIIYSGAIDDNASNSSMVKAKFLENALDEIISGRKITISSTKPVGCTVKWRKLQ